MTGNNSGSNNNVGGIFREVSKQLL
jgi:hypothetical protein